MKIACISDLHMGDGKSSDSFHHKESDFLHFLDFLEDNYDLIVANGDVFETLKSGFPFQPLKQLHAVQNFYRRITERLHQKNYKLIAGNHDAVLESLGYSLSYYYEEANGAEYLFLHGHSFDPLRGSGPMLPLTSWFLGMLERAGWKNAESHFSWLDEEIGYITKKNNIYLLNDGAKKIYDVMNQKRPFHIIMGHTHENPRITEAGNFIYINTGGCLKKRIQYAHLDTENLESRICNFSRTNFLGIAVDTHYPRNQMPRSRPFESEAILPTK